MLACTQHNRNGARWVRLRRALSLVGTDTRTQLAGCDRHACDLGYSSPPDVPRLRRLAQVRSSSGRSPSSPAGRRVSSATGRHQLSQIHVGRRWGLGSLTPTFYGYRAMFYDVWAMYPRLTTAVTHCGRDPRHPRGSQENGRLKARRGPRRVRVCPSVTRTTPALPHASVAEPSVSYRASRQISICTAFAALAGGMQRPALRLAAARGRLCLAARHSLRAVTSSPAHASRARASAHALVRAQERCCCIKGLRTVPLAAYGMQSSPGHTCTLDAPTGGDHGLRCLRGSGCRSMMLQWHQSA